MDEFIKNELILADAVDEIDRILRRPLLRANFFFGKNVLKQIRTLLNPLIYPLLFKVTMGEIKQLLSLQQIILALDDIQDGSPLRKEIPTPHTIFGIPATLLAIDAGIADLQKVSLKLKGSEGISICMGDMILMLVGQATEMKWTKNGICPTEMEYFTMVHRKTSSGFILMNRILDMPWTPSNDNCMGLLGIYLQVWDDYWNLLGDRYSVEKGYAEDITEGKFGFPTVHACNSDPEVAKILQDILKEHTQDVEKKTKFIDLLHKCGSFQYSREKLNELKKMIDNELKILPNTVTIEGIITAMHNWDGKSVLFN